MPETHDLDRLVGEDEALVLKIGGREYRLTDLTVEQMEAADALVDASQQARTNGQRDPYILHKQLAMLLGEPQERFFAEGYRKVQKALRLIYAHLSDARGLEAGKGGSSRG